MCLAKCTHSIARNAAITFFAAAAITCVAVAGVVAVVATRSAN